MPQAAAPNLAIEPAQSADIAALGDMRDALKDPSLSMTQLMRVLKTLDASGHARDVVKVGISSSVTVEIGRAHV